MSVESSGNAKDIFLAAIEIESAADRNAYIQEACAADKSLRKRVNALILAHEAPDSLLNGNAPKLSENPETEPTVDFSFVERPGAQIGPYKLRERLGVGGMGVVWAAEQKQPLRRKVALKVIKPGMDSEMILARFEAEREALSRMEHVNIARVLDAGTTQQGRPYFVMELIRGVPITDYCDAKKLPIRDRVELFIQACKAVQHAHQKGIIHRDIKPSNILVGEQDDGQPVLKIIDFGVAKALHQPLTDRSVYTSVFQAIGTLAYMSPEQAGLNISDIDTRTDIYGLGVLLYELLTGNTPFDKEELASAALDEACRMIRERDPLKPSTRITSLGGQLDAIVIGRRTDASGLEKRVRGDLDWIVMKALEKDRSRRYETASSFAADLERHLKDEPVRARAPSLRYRAQKYMRRNRGAVLTAATVCFAMIATTITSTVFGLWALKSEEVAQAAFSQQEALVASLLDQAKQNALAAAMSGRREEALLAITRARKAGASSEWKMLLLGIVDLYSGRTKEAIETLSKAKRTIGDDNPECISIRSVLATTYMFSGRIDEAVQEIIELQSLGDPTTAEGFLFKAQALYNVLPPDEVEELLAEYFRRRGDSAVGRLIRSITRQTIARRRGDLELVELAVVDSIIANELMPDSPLSYAARLGAHAQAELMYQDAGDRENAIQHRQIAIRLAHSLDGRADFEPAYFITACFFDRAGDVESADKYWTRYVAWRKFGSFHWCTYAQFLVRNNDMEGAYDAFDAAGQLGMWETLVKATISLDSPGKRDEAIKTLEQLLSCPVEDFAAVAAALLLITDSAYEMKVVKAKAPKAANAIGDRKLYDAVVKFFLGEFDDRQLKSVGNAEGKRVELYIALKSLAQQSGASSGQTEKIQISNTNPSTQGELLRTIEKLVERNVDWPNVSQR